MIGRMRKKWFGSEGDWPWQDESPPDEYSFETPRVVTLLVPRDEFMAMVLRLPSIFDLPVLSLAHHEAGEPDKFILRDFDSDAAGIGQLYIECSGYDYARYKAMICM